MMKVAHVRLATTGREYPTMTIVARHGLGELEDVRLQ